MRVTIIGSTGHVGHHLTTEAVRRGHTVTCLIRDPHRATDLPAEVTRAHGDVTDPQTLTRHAADSDAVLAAIRPPHGQEGRLVDMTHHLLDGMRATSTRLISVGGAATLQVDDTGRLVVDDPRYLHPAATAIAQACVDQHDVYRKESDVDWTYVSPPPTLTQGPRTGRYRLGADTLVLDTAGDSEISAADLAVAILDEVDQPRHRRRRFTAAY
ncbi:NAD(P)H-binding protein [Spiractinospora alimapuensis]|uniref:NAD(P)-dependent oxidoreductase n=1 Tax=Spiractinospora alimapuensis TaxID=2820884 RepID=UPI001F38C9C2|nr:NAD(P)H-binding protein [Spiractinospora alimapuensis]QVQ52568.1 NAD(P)H-binding protein [Spiractinospora alimapuensis]